MKMPEPIMLPTMIVTPLISVIVFLSPTFSPPSGGTLLPPFVFTSPLGPSPDILFRNNLSTSGLSEGCELAESAIRVSDSQKK